MIKIISLILLAEIWGTTGQVFYKKSVNKLSVPNLRSPKSLLGFMKNIMRMPTIWLGLGFIGTGLVIWLAVLAQTDLSIAFPIDSLQYIITLAAAHMFLGEKINRMKIIGTLLIMGGILLVAVS